jgi:hypothetical protein
LATQPSSGTVAHYHLRFPVCQFNLSFSQAKRNPVEKNGPLFQSPHLAADLQKMASFRDARWPESLFCRSGVDRRNVLFCSQAIVARAATYLPSRKPVSRLTTDLLGAFGSAGLE